MLHPLRIPARRARERAALSHQAGAHRRAGRPDPAGSTPQQFAAFFRIEVERYAQVIKSADIRGD